MLRVKYILLAVTALYILTSSGCDFNADRDNPLDSEGDYSGSHKTITGKITRQDGSTPIPNVTILLTPELYSGYSDSSGNYAIQCSSSGFYTMTLTHPDYKTIFDEVNLPIDNNLILNFSMDAVPVIDSFSVTSQRLRYNIDVDLYNLKVYIYAAIFDPDGSSQMDSSVVEAHYNNETILMSGNQDNVYDYTIDQSAFPEQNIENLFSVPFIVRVIDKDGDTTCSEPTELNMFLDFSLTPEEPCIDWGTGMVQKPEIPIFSWGFPDFVNCFEHKYILSIISDQTEIFNKTLYDTTTNFFVDDTLYNDASFSLIEDTLDAGDYTWSVKLLNTSGDYTRSAIFTFSVKD